MYFARFVSGNPQDFHLGFTFQICLAQLRHCSTPFSLKKQTFNYVSGPIDHFYGAYGATWSYREVRGRGAEGPEKIL